MSRIVAWLAGAIGLAVLLRRRRGRAGVKPEFDPAAELRRKLDESRAVTADDPAEPEPGDTPADVADTVDDRRRRVHDAGRAALEDMHGSSTD